MIKRKLYKELEVRIEHPKPLAQLGRSLRNRNWIIEKGTWNAFLSGMKRKDIGIRKKEKTWSP